MADACGAGPRPGLPEVSVGGKPVGFWAFDASNVLKWDNEAGTSAWLQFCVLPGGPVFLGALHDAAASAPVAGARPLLPRSRGAWQPASVPVEHGSALHGTVHLCAAPRATRCVLAPPNPMMPLVTLSSLAAAAAAAEQQPHRPMSGADPKGAAAAAAGAFSCFGELMSQPSRLAPNAAMDATVGQLIADGLGTSATILVSNLLRTAAKCARAAICRPRVSAVGRSARSHARQRLPVTQPLPARHAFTVAEQPGCMCTAV